jgi:acylphosphatase
MIARRFSFEGRVQGIGFRYTVKDLARGFDVSGWVRNLPDGTVQMLAAGEEAEIDAFLGAILRDSPVAGNIRSHRVWDEPVPAGLAGFRIER